MAFRIDELYYELDARTAGFEDNINRAKTTTANFAQFIRDKPMLAVAAFAAALIGVAAAATRMAADVDREMRRVQAAFPGATAEIDKLRKGVADLSEITPRSQRELAAAAADIAEKGVESVDAIISRLRISTAVADATGASLEAVADGLDQISDAFRLTDKEAERALVTIAGYAQGKVGLDEVFATLARGGAILADLNVTAEDAGQAMVALIDAGIPRRQAGTVLQTILELSNRTKELRKGTEEQRSAAVIIETALSRETVAAKGFIGALGQMSEQLTKAGVDTRELGIQQSTLSAVTRVAEAAASDNRTEAERLADSYDRLYKAAQTNNESADALSQLLVNQLNRAFVNLGNVILPTVISGLNKTLDLLRQLRGETNAMKALEVINGPLPTVRPRQRLGETTLIQPTEEHARARKFEGAVEDLAGLAEREGGAGFIGVPRETLERAQRHIQQLLKAQPDRLAGNEGRQYLALELALREAIKTAIASEDSGSGGGGGGGGSGVTALTEEIKSALASLRQAMNDALIAGTKTEIDDARARVARFAQDVEELERKAGRRLPELRADLERVAGDPARVEAKERAEAAREIANEVTTAVNIQSQVMEQALGEFNRQIAERNAEYAKLGKAPLFTAEQVARVNEIRQALIDATKSAEETGRVLSTLGVDDALGGRRTRGQNAGSAVTLEATLGDRRRQLIALEGKTDPASEIKRKALLEEIAQLMAKINELAARNAQIEADANNVIRERISNLEEMSAAISQGVDLALELAEAFNFGRTVEGILRTIGSIGRAAGSMGPFLEKLKLFRAGTKDEAGNPLVGIGGLLGAAAPVVGGVIGAVGIVKGLLSDPKVDAARAETVAALRTLRQSIDKLNDTYLQNVSGTTIEKTIADLERLLGGVGTSGGALPYTTFNGERVLRPGEGNGPGRRGNLRDIGNAIGRDFNSGALERYFAEMDAKYGTNLAEFVRREDPFGLLEALKAVPEALRRELGELGRFADSAAGIIERVNYQFDVLGKTDAAERFRAIVEALTAAGIDLGDFASTFATLNDPKSTAEQKQSAIDEALARILKGENVNYGGLTPEELRQLLKQGADISRGTGTGTGGYNTDRTITEVTGARLAAIMSTSQIFLEQIAKATREMAGILSGRSAPAGITPPALAGGWERFGGTPINVTVYVDGRGMTPEAADAVGQRVGGAVVNTVNRTLGKDLLWRKRAAGDTQH